ncbi:PKD domain-containing protein [Nocardioides flavescens]|uniref:PKD domain-containing protein n=1 Tax=Nocardioides flavescens TaxID=2691959 RepID=A0A6L7EZU1_9ACTN|nr:PKD domain-containing protein [Nocardioides flavescens]MXG91368.1 PKD domain-containing protein [Nocardioides flavescens]
MPFSVHRRLLAPLLSGALALAVAPALSAPATAVPSVAPAAATGPASLGTPSRTTVGALTLENSFVSAVGWVKPAGTAGQDGTYPSRLLLRNSAAVPTAATVTLTAPDGTSVLSASGPGTHAVAGAGSSVTWTVTVPAAASAKAPGTATLVLQQRADSLAETPTLVWRDLSTTATLKVGTSTGSPAYSHGPKVIPPSSTYDTARYGDRPFPIVPVQYRDRAYQSTHTGDSLESVVNDPTNTGSTFNLFQEMSLGQLYPEGDVPSVGVATAGFSGYAPGFPFTNAKPGNTCLGTTYADLLGGATGPAAAALQYDKRITNGVYNLPGDTGYYGSDSNGSAVVGSLTGVGALQNIDSGCGDTGKLVADSVAIADPEIDYSDFDTDKDGVVDFFMVVFAGCGGNGASQLSVAGCDYKGPGGTPSAPYDNVWPHSSTLENGYTDPVTGLPGFTTDDQLKDLQGRPLWYREGSFSEPYTTTDRGDAHRVLVRVGPYNVNPETAIDAASVISHEYGHSLGLPDFYSTGSRETYGDWNLMATDKSQDMDAYSRQELGWVVPEVLDSDRTESSIPDSKQDVSTISWETPDGTPYTLREGQNGVGRVQNSQMYVAKLPGRKLLDASAFDTGDKASASHLWWSGSGNDFGCAPQSGRNFDLAIPGLSALTDPNATVTLSFKSRWDIEWDFDYGFVLTTTDGGKTYRSHASQKGYTSSNTDPLAANPNNNACQATYDNGLTGTSGSYAASSQAADRKLGNTPAPVFLADSYDISDLAGAANGALRFSYATDPGLARPGWFVDDVKVSVDPDGPNGSEPAYDALASDFETSGGPSDPAVYNGGCREDLTTASSCTLGWRYLQAGAEAEQDHAYYLEMRDRSGFDLDGHGQADRGAVGWGAGFYAAYTDETHGYGNVGTDDPPAQSPLDSVPTPGSDTPDLNDAAFVASVPARSTFSDSSAAPHVDNYKDPTSASGNWEFGYDCLAFKVLSMSGESNGPATSDGDLTGTVSFDVGQGCGDFDYGYADPSAPGAGGGQADTAPTAVASADPTSTTVGTTVRFSGAGSTDAESPGNLTYSWDLGDGSAKLTGRDVTHAYQRAGTYRATLTVSDPSGRTGTASVTVQVAATTGAGSGTGAGTGTGASGPVARIKVKTKRPVSDRRVKLVAKASTGTGSLTYRWNFHNGGKKVDARGVEVKPFLRRPGRHEVTLTVIDSTGAVAKATVVFRVRYRR